MHQTQDVWRTVSNVSHNGVFVWEIMEFVGTGAPKPEVLFEQCRDGSWILPCCYHYFDIAKAEAHLNSQDMTEFGAVYHTI